MDDKITKRIQDWMYTPRAERNIPEGAMLLLKINQNKVLYRNILAKPEKMHDKLEYELGKQLQWRLKQVTHEQIVQMEEKAEGITSFLDEGKEGVKQDFRTGIREDHEQLPDEIRALYVENKSLMQRMRDLHAQLRIIQQGRPGYVCKDSDKYPFLKELLELDRKYRDNWARYDNYDVKTAESIERLDARQENRKALAFINFNKGKYRSQPNEELRGQLAAAYAKVTSPTAKLTSELIELGIIQGRTDEEGR